MIIDDDNLVFTEYDEQDISWGLHNKIHESLNIAYNHRTSTFVTKTYPNYPPRKRILCTLNDKIIGHIAIFDSKLIYKSEEIKFAGIGMTLSVKPFLNLAYQLRKRAADICAEYRYPFAIGRVKNSERIKNNLSSLVTHFLNIPLIGKATKSHDWEVLAVYSTRYDKKYVDEIMRHCIEAQSMNIAGEVF